MIKNIVLVGMPSSGKSTVGKLLAEKLQMTFFDTDALITEKTGKTPKDIVNTDGLKAFLKIQEELIVRTSLQNHVVATGGSVIYGKTAMQHLKSNGMVVYLMTDYEEIAGRLASGRRFARNEGQSLLDLYNERVPLYVACSDMTVDCAGKDAANIADEIAGRLNGNS